MSKHAAIHEAGHAILARALGLRVEWAQVNSGIGDPRSSGVLRQHSDRQTKNYAVCVAGPIAERMYQRQGWSQSILIGASEDFERARACGLSREDARTTCEDVARALMIRWPAIEAVADELALHRRLDGAAIDAVIKRAGIARFDSDDKVRLDTMDWGPVMRATTLSDREDDALDEIVDALAARTAKDPLCAHLTRDELATHVRDCFSKAAPRADAAKPARVMRTEVIEARLDGTNDLGKS